MQPALYCNTFLMVLVGKLIAASKNKFLDFFGKLSTILILALIFSAKLGAKTQNIIIFSCNFFISESDSPAFLHKSR